MSIPLTGTGGLFTRLGRLGRLAYVSAGDQAAAATALASLVAQYPTTDHVLVSQLEAAAASLARSVGASLTSVVQALARQTLLAMVTEDVPAAGGDVTTALTELVRQMKAGSASVAGCAVALTPTAFTSPSNTGNGVLVTSVRRGDGLVQENAAADQGRLACVADSYTGGASAGRESFLYTGAPQTAGLWDYDYPTGSGGSAGLTSATPADGPLGNTDFETWSGSPLAADDWTITVGTWATDAVRDATPHAGTYSLRLAAGATLTSLYQAFPAGGLTPLTSLAVNLWLRTAAGTASGGVLTVELTDGSGTVVNDQYGAPNAFTADLTALTTAWASAAGVFRLPEVMPAEVRLRVRVSTALSGADVLLDDLATSPLTRLYAGGPGAAVFAGATPWLLGDGWDVAVTNDRAGAAYLATFQALFDRLFNTTGLGVLLPTGGTATIPDTLITTP